MRIAAERVAKQARISRNHTLSARKKWVRDRMIAWLVKNIATASGSGRRDTASNLQIIDDAPMRPRRMRTAVSERLCGRAAEDRQRKVEAVANDITPRARTNKGTLR